jgi:hypothetical protein
MRCCEAARKAVKGSVLVAIYVDALGNAAPANVEPSSRSRFRKSGTPPRFAKMRNLARLQTRFGIQKLTLAVLEAAEPLV